MSQFVLAPKAANDLQEMWDYIAAHNVSAADRMLHRVADCLRLLSTQAEMGERRPDVGEEIRSFSVGNYVILFRRSAINAEVLRIVHGSRDVDSLTI